MLRTLETPTHTDQPIDDETVMLLLLAGTSESGKSAMGRYAHEQNLANRLKYLRIAGEASTAEYDIDDPFGYIENANPQIAFDHAQTIWTNVANITRQSNRVSVVETMKHPDLVAALGKFCANGEINANYRLVFVDAPLDARVSREASKTGLPEAEISESIAAKDAKKDALGMAALREMADVTIDNAGTYDDYIAYIDHTLRELNTLYPSEHPAIRYE